MKFKIFWMQMCHRIYTPEVLKFCEKFDSKNKKNEVNIKS